MSYLDNVRVFIRVVELGTLSAAGRDQRVTPAVASNRIKELERHLGVRLFNRTTRQLSPTEHGRVFYPGAVKIIEADANRSADTHLLRYPLPLDWGIDLYLKDESTHPTGSLKHRLARSLFLYAICNGWITGGAGTTAGSRPAWDLRSASKMRVMLRPPARDPRGGDGGGCAR